jgi:hypothetical protein
MYVIGTVEPRLSGPRLSGSPCYPETKSILKIPFYPEEFSSKLRLIRNWPCFVEILRSDKISEVFKFMWSRTPYPLMRQIMHLVFFSSCLELEYHLPLSNKHL